MQKGDGHVAQSPVLHRVRGRQTKPHAQLHYERSYMTSDGKPIRLNAHDDSLLRNLYKQLGIPRDQYKKRPADMAFLEKAWKNLSGRNDPVAELIRYMQNQQKAKRRLAEPWPTFDGNHKRAPSVSEVLDDEKMQALRTAYDATVLPLGLGTDAVAWNSEVVNALTKEFARLTGAIVPGLVLLAIAEEKRKRGKWLKVGRASRCGLGFGDLHEVAGLDND